MGRCLAPCDDGVGPERYGELARRLISSLSSPGELLEALERRMMRLAEADRFEEAAQARDRLRALSEALERRRKDRWLLGAGRLVLRDAAGRTLPLSAGALDGEDAGPIDDPCPRDRADELAAVRGWITRNPVVVDEAEYPPAEPVGGGAQLHRLLSILRGAEREPADRMGSWSGR